MNTGDPLEIIDAEHDVVMLVLAFGIARAVAALPAFGIARAAGALLAFGIARVAGAWLDVALNAAVKNAARYAVMFAERPIEWAAAAWAAA